MELLVAMQKGNKGGLAGSIKDEDIKWGDVSISNK